METSQFLSKVSIKQHVKDMKGVHSLSLSLSSLPRLSNVNDPNECKRCELGTLTLR